jgi:hypothetical protein
MSRPFDRSIQQLVLGWAVAALPRGARPPAPPPPGATPNPATPVSPAPATGNQAPAAAPAPVTPAPVTPAPVTPAPVTPAPVTPAPVTPAPVTPAPAAPAPPSAAAPADAAFASVPEGDTAVNEQLVAEAAGKASGEEYKLDIYGFADFTYSHLLNKKFYFAAPYNSFAVGNLNLYVASDLGSKFHSLAEVRFTYLPNGNSSFSPTGTAARTDTTASDYADIGRPVRWGGIVIERAWLEYAAHPLLNIRAGHWLTPYGIWNVDHGSPVVIGVQRPYIVGDQLLPQSQTGLELYGKHDFSAFELGYHLTLSNGRGPIDTYQDLNNNKAIGGRLFMHADTPAGSVTLGASAYTGRYTDRTQALVVNPDNTAAFSYPITADYHEVSYAADLKWEFSGFLLQSEFILNQIRYNDPRPALLGPTPAFAPDTQRWGVYGLAGYRFDFLGTMPYAELEYYDSGPSLLGKTADVIGGLNVRPTGRVVLKAQYIYAWFPGSLLPPDSHYNVLNFQAAWSF